MHRLEEGERCSCGGTAVAKLDPRCYCHLNPPCHYCVEGVCECEDCGLTEKED
jgi:hypothetical protein